MNSSFQKKKIEAEDKIFIKKLDKGIKTSYLCFKENYLLKTKINKIYYVRKK